MSSDLAARLLRRTVRATAVVGLLATALTPSATAKNSAPPLQPIVEAVSLRLATADVVATAKWGTLSPIDDPAREVEVLDRMSETALNEGLNPEWVQQIFRDQIEASKVVQHSLFAVWGAEPELAPTVRPDLSQVRPIIDEQDEVILAQLREQQTLLKSPDCIPALADATIAVSEDQHLDALHQVALARALWSICSPAG
ncbi:chorismate mutase [Rhodococcus sp. NPDC049939]|uniref:chorismate mutase n=1 Tax=Rhodococcus sp. NPDC049939 TaxID=3155511 RepID=UPI0033E7F7C0